MSSQKQTDANRRNAEKCTGPKTEAGKTKSSQNAFKTGIDSKSEVMPNENRAELDELTADFYRDYAPVGSGERALVDTLIKMEWLNRRYMSTRAAIWERTFEYSESRDMGKAFLREQNTFVRADRCHNSTMRNFDKALVRLTELQAKRGVRHPEIAPEPEQPSESAVAEDPLDAAAEPHNDEMVSFLQETTESPDPATEPAAESAQTPEINPENTPEKEIDPPIAA